MSSVYIEVCPSHCVNSACDTRDGNCSQECDPGYWGESCQFTCPFTCVEEICRRNNGHCINCPLGYWGDVCHKVCPPLCFGSVCSKERGVCIQGCDVGLYGDRCKNTCSPGCVKQTCEQQSGVCTAGCVRNWAGDRCDSMFTLIFSWDDTVPLSITTKIFFSKKLEINLTIFYIINVFSNKYFQYKHTFCLCLQFQKLKLNFYFDCLMDKA